jgi:hypothetical protein
MRARIALLKIKAKLLALLFIALVSTPSVPLFLALAYFSLGPILCYLGGRNFLPFAAFVMLSGWLNCWRYARELNPVHDEPLREPLASFPALQAELRTVCSDFGLRLPRKIAIVLSPWSWQPFAAAWSRVGAGNGKSHCRSAVSKSGRSWACAVISRISSFDGSHPAGY